MHSRSNSDPELNRDTDRWSKLKWLSEESRPLLPPRTESPAQPIFPPEGSGHNDNTQLNIQVDEAINETDRTIHKLLNRGEMLQDMNAKAEDLRNTSSLFTRSAHRVEKSLWWDQKYWKVIMYLIAVVFGMVIFVGLVKYVVDMFRPPLRPIGGPTPPVAAPPQVPGGGAGLVCNCICPPVLCPYFPPPGQPPANAPKTMISPKYL